MNGRFKTKAFLMGKHACPRAKGKNEWRTTFLTNSRQSADLPSAFAKVSPAFMPPTRGQVAFADALRQFKCSQGPVAIRVGSFVTLILLCCSRPPFRATSVCNLALRAAS